jgi:hypothetical protein
LIAAINTANTNPGADTVKLFACGTHTFSAQHNFEFERAADHHERHHPRGPGGDHQARDSAATQAGGAPNYQFLHLFFSHPKSHHRARVVASPPLAYTRAS